MSMIKCLECGRDISDKATKCPHCGIILNNSMSKPKQIICQECGSSLFETDEICSNCGCPLESKKGHCNEKSKSIVKFSYLGNSTFKKVIVVLIVLFILCLFGVIGSKMYNNKKATEEYNVYIDYLEVAKELMLEGGADAEYICDLTATVWYNSIYEEHNTMTDKFTCPDGDFLDDFNDALSNLFMDKDFVVTTNSIGSNIEHVKIAMKELQDVPEGLDNCYESITDLYTAYSKYTGLALNPIGSYNDFISSRNNSITEFMSAYDKLDLQIPEKSK